MQLTLPTFIILVFQSQAAVSVPVPYHLDFLTFFSSLAAF